jgi:hypothetical protein
MHRNRGLNHFIYHDYCIENDKQYVFYEKDCFLELKDETPINESNAQLIHLYRALDKYVMENNKLIEIEYENLNSKIFHEFEKRDTVEGEGLYPMNILDIDIDPFNLHSVDVYYEFDVKIESDLDNYSLKVVTQMKNNKHENNHCMDEDIFDVTDKNSSEWTHFEFHYVYNNEVFNFKENKRMVIFVYNPEDISKILIRNRKTKVVVNSYK